MIRLSVVLDEWARPEPPVSPASAQINWGLDYIRLQWQLDAMLAARILAPGPLCIVTGC